MKKILGTGSSRLIGSEVVEFFCGLGWSVRGVDNNMRADFFGDQGDTRWNQERLKSDHDNFDHYELDISDRQKVCECIEQTKPDLVVHTAAQPSHDLAASRPFDDFDVNAVGTFNLIEATRLHARDAVFVHIYQQGVRRQAEHDQTERARHTLELR